MLPCRTMCNTQSIDPMTLLLFLRDNGIVSAFTNSYSIEQTVRIVATQAVATAGNGKYPTIAGAGMLVRSWGSSFSASFFPGTSARYQAIPGPDDGPGALNELSAQT